LNGVQGVGSSNLLAPTNKLNNKRHLFLQEPFLFLSESFSFILLIGRILWLQIDRKLWMLYLFAVIYGIAHGGILPPFRPSWPNFSE